MLSETHITEDFLDCQLKIQGYILIRCDSNSRHTGGVASMYIDENIKFDIVCKKHLSWTWYICIKIVNNIMNGYFAVFYKSPKEKVKYFINDIFDEFCEEHINDDNENLIVGDFNINFARKSKYTVEYLELLREYNLAQLIEEFTRVDEKKNSKTIIDHVLSNNKKQKRCNINERDKIGDHFMIEIKCNINSNVSKKNENLEIVSWKKYDAKKVMELTNNINWQNANDHSLNIFSENSHNNLKYIVTNIVEKKNITFKNNPWYTKELRSLKNEQDMYFKRFEYTNNIEDKLQ